jgi:hypothetical protein
MIPLICAVLGLLIIAACVWAVLLYPGQRWADRTALIGFAVGVLWGGFNRLSGLALGLGDVVMLAAGALLVWRFIVFNPKIGSTS